jgi:pimeloyl-ACP methyl ester carboxylesterase
MHTIDKRAWGALCVSASLLGGIDSCGAVAATASGTRISEETVHIQGPVAGLHLGLRHASRADSPRAAGKVVLLLPGAAVPVSGNPDYPFTPGRSLMTALAETGLDVWALDYYGYGESDRYPQMQQPADTAVLGRADDCARQVEAAVAFLQQKRGVARIMLIGDSAGTMVAGVFAAQHPDMVSRLILFGPVTPFTSGPASGQALPSYALMTPRDLWDQFTSWSEEAGAPRVLDAGAYEGWAREYLRSDPTSGTRTPPSVRIPNGFQHDTAEIAAGRFVYDPGLIKAPTLLVMGESDQIATFQGAQWLLRALHQAASRELLVIGHGSHTIQFESERTQLYRAMGEFLNRHEWSESSAIRESSRSPRV